MPVKKSINTAIHLVFCLIIALLLAFIVRENAMDYDDDIQVLARKTAQNGQLVIAVNNKKLLRECIKETKEITSATAIAYDALMRVVKLKSDSIQYLIDSLSEKEDVELLYAVQEMLPKQRSLIIKMADTDRYIEGLLPKLQPSDWLFQSWKNDTKEQYKMVLKQAKINGLLMESVAINYFASKVTGYDYNRSILALNWKSIGSNVGDKVSADILLIGFGQGYYDRKFTVNGISVPDYIFRQRFDKAGTYPLHLKVESNYWENDTIIVAEKTYYVTVRK
jgi:hypothetical protein